MERCPWCVAADSKEDIEKYLYSEWMETFFGKQIVYATLCQNSIEVMAGERTIMKTKIKYCPMCGRKLREKQDLE